MIFDTHAHYDDEAFEEDRGALIASLAEQGIGRVVNVAADLASVSTSLTLAQQYPFIYAAVGVHPSNVQELTERDYEWLEEKLAAPKAVAVGEIGTGLLLGQRARGAGASAGKLFQTASACQKAG